MSYCRKKQSVVEAINQAWDDMKGQARDEMSAEVEGEISFTPLAMIRYGGQLSDLELVSQLQWLTGPRDLDALIVDWEDLYARINSRVAKYELAGYQIFELGMLATVEKVKPRLVEHELGPPTPTNDARKSTRNIYHNGEWHVATTWEMELLKPGNHIDGPAIIEHPATTLVVPAARSIDIDRWNFIWLKGGGSQA